MYNWDIHRKCCLVLTSAAKGDHDVSYAAVDSCESQRSDFGPNLQCFLYGVIYLCHRHVRCVVLNPVRQKNIEYTPIIYHMQCLKLVSHTFSL